MQLLINNNSVNSDIDANLRHLLIDEEVENIKKENVETKKDLQMLKIKILDLKQMWKSHIQVGSTSSPPNYIDSNYCCQKNIQPADRQASTVSSVAPLAPLSAPKKLLSSLMEGSAGSVSRLEEELVSSRLSEVEAVARLQETEARLREVEQQARAGRLQLGRQEQLVRRLQGELEVQRRKQAERETQLREADIRRANMEGKLKVGRDTGYIIISFLLSANKLVINNS